MNNKLLAALAMTTALATSAHSACQINSGAYVGLSVGGAHLGGKNDFSHTNDGAPNNTATNNSGVSANSFAASIFAGYGLKFNNLWTALELFAQFDNLKDKNEFKVNAQNNSNFKKITSNGAFGGAVHLGYTFNNCIIYAIAGAEVRRFKAEFSSGDKDAIAAEVSKNYTSTAFAPGLGVRVNLSKNVSIRTEYKYAIHRKKTLNATATNAAIGGKDNITLKASPTIQTFNVGLVYSF